MSKKNAQPENIQPGTSKIQRNYSTLQATIKAMPWLALQALVGIVLTLSAGGLAP